MSKSARLKPSRPTAVDLFSGVGGLSLGIEQAGFDVLAAVEYDPIHAATHLYNFPMTTMICRDIRTVDGSELLDVCRDRSKSMGVPFGGLDLVMGGPPCQGLSIGGLHKRHDPRNELLWEFHRIITEIRAPSLRRSNRRRRC